MQEEEDRLSKLADTVSLHFFAHHMHMHILSFPDETITTFAVFTLAPALEPIQGVVERTIFLGCLIFGQTIQLLITHCFIRAQMLT